MIGDFKFYEVGGKIRDELIKCFRCNTIRTLTYLDYLPRLRDYIFSKTNLWLKPTNEK